MLTVTVEENNINKMKRQDIVKELNIAQEKARELRNQLEEFDREERLKKANSYLGKCYIASDEMSDYIRCLYVYNVNEQCIPDTVYVSYFKDSNVHFQIESYGSFPGYDEDDNKWVEISKQEFENHYNHVQTLVKNTINSLVQEKF